jgi:hypothetical protein
VAKTESEQMAEHLDQVNEVVTEHLKGENPTEISKALSMPRVKVVQYLDEWKVMIADNQAIRSRAHEALAGADEHYSKLINKAYEVIDSADGMQGTASLGIKNGSIKLIVDIEAKRIDMLQKSGMLDNSEIAEQLVESEEKQDVLEKILKDVVSDCHHCKTEVMKRLATVADPNEAVVVQYNV